MGVKASTTVTINGTLFTVYTYKPDGDINGILLTFHGADREADVYRDAMQQISDKMGYYVLAPLFDEARFSVSAYQLGGVVVNGQVVADQSQWTTAYVKPLAEWAAAYAGLTDSDDIVLFGHSGGGQFLSRVAGYTSGAQDSFFDKIIIANAGTHVWPSFTENAPYGYGLFPQATAEAMMQDYFADPITLYQGSLNTDNTAPGSSTSDAAMRQGPNTFQRGLNVYSAAQQMAASRGWAFNWELVIAEGVGHAAGDMARAPEMTDAIDTDGPPNVISGGIGNDVLNGTLGADLISGNAGDDILAGGTGIDHLFGGAGNDTFDFNAVGQSEPGDRSDVIEDFSNAPGNDDKIDLSGIDARRSTSYPGDQAFTYKGTLPFTGGSGQVRWYYEGDDTIVEGTTNADTVPDFRIRIKGHVTLTSSDFVL